MNARRIQVFVSSTTYDLASARALVKDGLFDLGCVPVERPDFHPDYGEARRLIAQRIAGCDALVHIAGECYGGEPTTLALGQRRRSYAQLEYDIAQELGKPIHAFVCQPGFDYDPCHPEDPERQELQREHRQAIVTSGHSFTEVTARADLARKLGQLQPFLDVVQQGISRALGRLLWGVAAAVLVLGVLAPASLFLQGRYCPDPRSRPAPSGSLVSDRLAGAVLAELGRQGLALRTRADGGLDIPKACRVVAEQFHRTEAQMAKEIGEWVAAHRPSADLSAWAQAEFLVRNFSQAAALSEQEATDKLRWSDHAPNKKARLRDKAALDWQRAGEALRAAGQPAEALARFDRALTCVSRVALPQSWALLQDRRGLCCTELGLAETGTPAQRHLSQAVSAYRAAAEVWTRTQFPQAWAGLQEQLGVTLSAQAQNGAGAEALRLLNDAARAYRNALEVFTATNAPAAHARVAQGLQQVEARLQGTPASRRSS
jgi:tetratricopeptide (TPR) repeat protein